MSKSDLEGKKDYGNKPRVDLVLPEAIIGLGEVLGYGARKYGANTWQNVTEPFETHYASAMRHLLAWRMGEKNDPESGLHHLKHAMSNLMFLMDHEKEGRK